MIVVKDWNEPYSGFDALSQEDRDEIELKLKIIGEVLKARKDKGLTQAELESISGVKQTYIARFENNKTDPQLTTILKILRPLGMTLKVAPLEQNTALTTGIDPFYNETNMKILRESIQEANEGKLTVHELTED